MIRFVLIVLLLGVGVANAETVKVKYRGPVSLDAFECPSLKESSFVNRICYDRANSYLIVQLKKAYYQYCEIPASTFSEWITAPSLGRFYNQKIKGGIYGCQGKLHPSY